MKKFKSAIFLMLCPLVMFGASGVKLIPAPGATNVNIDTRLSMIFDMPPSVGDAGVVRIHDAATGAVVDSLDLSIPAGPTESTCD